MNNSTGRDLNFEEFVTPSKENSIIYTWKWDTPIDFAYIDRELTGFKKAGIGGLYILPLPKNFRPKTMQSCLEPEYLSPEYFECVKHAAEKGKELGIEMWIYDEGGWPSGGACGKTFEENPKSAETVVLKRDINLACGQKYLPSDDAVAIFDGKKRVFEGFEAKTDLTISEYYLFKCDDRHPNRVDSTNKSVIDTFIDNTYEAYKQGLSEAFDEISAIFTDEPSVIRGLIPENFFDNFKKEYGYDAKDYLYCIFDRNLAKSREECLARIHYGRMLGRLFYENFCVNIADWCKKNNKLFTGHLDKDNVPEGAAEQCYFSHLNALSAFDVPGVDVIWHQIGIPVNGVSVTEGVSFFPRLASSAAHQTDKNLAITESLGVYGDGVTPDEFRYVLNYQAIRGINVFNVMMLSPDSLSGIVERLAYSTCKPGFYNMEHINTYFARLSYLLRLGKPVINTALYIPCADFWANDEIAKKASESYGFLGEKLENADVEFDIIDDYAIEDAKATESGLKIGNMCYNRIVVPECEFMPEDVRKKITPYLGAVKTASGINTGIRTMKRELPSGMLYFVFNESAKAVSYKADFDAEHLYRLSPLTGEVTFVPDGAIEIPCGEIAVFYASDKELDCVCNDVEYSASVGNFEWIGGKRFVILEGGLSLEDVTNPEIADGEFSGEFTYRAEYELPKEPNKGDRYKIGLLETAVSARISLDGKQVATVGIEPMEAIICGCDLKKQGTIEITVANTAGNELARKNDMIMSLPPEIRGPYHEKSIEYERKAPALKFGRVEMVKLM